jgi:hypothetical protein
MSRSMVMIIGLVLAACFFIGAAEALPIKQISAGAVLTLNSDYLDRSWGTGFTIGVGTALKVKKNLFVTTDLNYYHLTLKKGLVADEYYDGDVNKGTTNIIDFTINFKPRLFPTEFRNSPYIIMGGGLVYKAQDAITVSYYRGSETIKSSHEICPMYDFGFGFDLTSRNNKGFFIEAKYVFGFFKDRQAGFFPIKIGLLF